MDEMKVDVAVIGGGLGGCAAALAATALGRSVVLTEETDWIGGQLTAQAVPPDENPWIESFGCTCRYRALRDTIRRIYRDWYPLTAESRAEPHLNPGQGGVSRVCCEPRVALLALNEMLAYQQATGRLRVLLRTKAVRAQVDGDRVRSVTVADQETGAETTIHADYFVDATELGDLLPMTGTEYVTGAESREQTDEPHASDEPRPHNEQAITWVFAMGYDPGANHVGNPPVNYRFWRGYVPDVEPAWSGPLLSLTHTDPVTLAPRDRVLLPSEADQPWQAMWLYRRIICAEHYPSGAMPGEVTIVNWPQNDYLLRGLIDVPARDAKAALDEARNLSLSLLYWLQTEAPRPDGGTGYPGLFLRPDVTGTPDGLAKYPYIRESRRIKAQLTVVEQHVGVEARKAVGLSGAETFDDSVGIGCYRIDLHPSTEGDNYIDVGAWPFQIPLGSLLPVRMRNLLPACKNLGVTHITNGCFRLHPVEWNIGEAAGALAAHCLNTGTEPTQIRATETLLRDFQHLLENEGVELSWPTIHAV